MRLAARWPVGFVDQIGTCIRVHERNMSADPSLHGAGDAGRRALRAGRSRSSLERARGREAVHARLHVRDHRPERVRQRPARPQLARGWVARCATWPAQLLDPRFLGALGRAAVGPGHPQSSQWRRGMPPGRERASILFARNLFLPDDLGGNRYPYETMRRFGERGLPGHRRHAAAARPLSRPLAERALPPVPDPAPAPGSQPLHQPAGRHAGPETRLARTPWRSPARTTRRSPLAWAGVVPRRRWCSSSTRSSTRSGSRQRRCARQLLRRYMAAVERRVFALSARIVAVSEFSARQIRARAPRAADRVRVVPDGRRHALLFAHRRAKPRRGARWAWMPTSRWCWASDAWPASSSSTA